MLEKLLTWLGFGLCHQLPDRSYILGGLQAPVCVRDTGIYVGFILSFAILALVQRNRPRNMPRGHVWATMGFLLLFMAWDGVTSYAGLRTTVNELRLITGLGVGFSAAVLVFPMLNDELWRRGSSDRVLDPPWRYGVWLGSLPLAWAVITYIGPYLGTAFVLMVAMSIPATLTVVNLVMVAMLPWFDRRAEHGRDLLLPVAIAFAVAIAEIALAAEVRLLLIKIAASAGS